MTESQHSPVVGGGPPVAAPQTARLDFVDNLRVALTILVVLHHSALSFMGSDGLSVGVLTLFTLVNQAYFMGLFFLVSGYFVPGSLARKGTVSFVRGRLLRLVVPLIGYVVLLSPITALDVNSGADLSGPWWRIHLTNMSVGALWFLEVLVVLTLGYAFAVALTRRITHRGGSVPRTAPPVRRPLPSALQVSGLVLLIASATFLVRMVLPFGAGLLNVPTPSHLPQYLALFLVGVAAYRRDWFRQATRRAGLAGFGLAMGASLILFPLALVNTPAFMGGSLHWSSFAYALWESCLSVGLALGLLWLFGRRFDRRGRLGTYLSTHAFTVFLLHLPVIACLTLFVGRLPDLPFLGFLVGAPTALVISFLLAYPIRSCTPLRRIL